MNDNWYVAKVQTGDEGVAVDALLAVAGIERPFSFAPGYVMFICADITTVESQINSLHAIQSLNTAALQPWEAEPWLRPPGDWADLPNLGSTDINDCPACGGTTHQHHTLRASTVDDTPHIWTYLANCTNCNAHLSRDAETEPWIARRWVPTDP